MSTNTNINTSSNVIRSIRADYKAQCGIAHFTQP